eukprot:351655-Amorphochlora_amoeboformis.AAC.1
MTGRQLRIFPTTLRYFCLEYLRIHRRYNAFVNIQISFPEMKRKPLEEVVPRGTKAALRLLDQLL